MSLTRPNADQIKFTPSGGVSATNLQDAVATIAEITTDNQSSSGAANIGFAPTGSISATTVQGAIEEVVSDLSASIATKASLTGVETLTNKTLTAPVITSPTVSTPVVTGSREVSVALVNGDINLSTGNYFTKTISGNTTLTVSNVPTAGTAISFILDLTNGGSANLVWFSGVKWAGGAAPTLTSAGRDVIGFYTYDAGTTWTGLFLAKDVK